MVLPRTRGAQPLLRFVRSAFVGVGATLVDVVSLTLLVEVLRLSPSAANVPSLVLGALVQFFGNRHLVFEAKQGSMGRQLVGFLFAETGALALNAILFQMLIAHTPVPYLVARPLGQALVYVGFSYPMWTLVFRRGSSRATRQARDRSDEE